MPTRILATVVDPQRRRVEARTEDGHLISMDADPPDGDAAAAGPKEALLAALAGCTAMDVAAILARKRQRVDRYELEVTGDSAAEHPKVFTRIEVEHRVSGEVEPEALRRSIELSATRYCPINAMLSRVANIEHRYRLERPGEASVSDFVVAVGPAGSRVF